jgi:AcrR family transcriptional regulator
MTKFTQKSPPPSAQPVRRRGRPAQAQAPQERRRRLIEAAMRVIEREGLAATSTRAVAAEAGMNQAMLHYSFAGKDALLGAVLDEIHAGVAEVLAGSVAGATDLAQGIARIAEAYWAHTVNTPGLQRMQYELTLYALNTPEHAALARRQYEGYVAALSAAFEALPAPAGSPSRRVLAGICVAAMDGLILQHLATGDRAAGEAQLRLLVAALQSQLGSSACSAP